jgi:cysteine desulfurase family protein (TIGR01976 family)
MLIQFFDSMNNPFRSQFPSLSRQHNGKPLIFIDGPAGTQVPTYVINAMGDYYKTSNSNTHGTFVTTNETDALMSAMRKTVADFLGAEGPETISVGQNMTTLNFSLARGIGRMLQPGDEILITQLDHEGNRGPWLSLREQGIVVREVNLLDNGLLDYEDFEKKINHRTRLVAMGMASNAIGTVNDFRLVRKLTYKYNAWLLLDAVHYAPHFSIDVQEIGSDFLLCSAYKFYGPHVGILYAKPGLLDQVPTDRLRVAVQTAPEKMETGTLNHAAMAGVKACIEFISQQGSGNSMRTKILDAYNAIGKHERVLAEKLYNGLKEIPGIKIIGQPFASVQRSPTISFYKEGKTALEVCQHLAEKNICAWDGHFYAIRAIEILGLLEKGGVTRMGISAYNTEEEIASVVKVVKGII